MIAIPRKLMREINKRLLYYGLCFVLSVIFILPVWWMCSTSFMTYTQVYSSKVEWFPKPFVIESYRNVLFKFPFFGYLRNSLIVTISVWLGTVISSSLVAYAFSRLYWPGRDAIFILILSTMMLPGQVTMIPLFVVFRHLGWINSFKPLIIPAYLGGGPFFIFLMRQFMMGIPRELSDAAHIDGCSEFGIFWRIILPLCKPAIAAVSIFCFIGAWNDFLGPLIYLSSEGKKTLALGLLTFRDMYGTRVGELMAASALYVIPIIIMFAYTQSYFIKGITFTGLKG